MKIIDKDGLLKDLIRTKHEEFAGDKRKTRAIDKVIEIVTNYPHIERHARWQVYLDGKELMCSSCKATFWDEDGNGGTPYCPNCGAKLDGERSEDGKA